MQLLGFHASVGRKGRACIPFMPDRILQIYSDGPAILISQGHGGSIRSLYESMECDLWMGLYCGSNKTCHRKADLLHCSVLFPLGPLGNHPLLLARY